MLFKPFCFTVIVIRVGAAAIEIVMIKTQKFHQHRAQNIQLEVAQIATHGQARPKVIPSPKSNCILDL